MWAQSKEEQLGTYFQNLNRNLEQAETYEEYMELSRRLSLLEYKRECRAVRDKISRNIKPPRDNPHQYKRKLSEDVQRYLGLLKIPVRLKDSGPMVMSDHRTGQNWFFSFATKHPTNLKVNFT